MTKPSDSIRDKALILQGEHIAKVKKLYDKEYKQLNKGRSSIQAPKCPYLPKVPSYEYFIIEAILEYLDMSSCKYCGKETEDQLCEHCEGMLQDDNQKDND